MCIHTHVNIYIVHISFIVFMQEESHFAQGPATPGNSLEIRHQSGRPEPVRKSGTSPEPVRKGHRSHPGFQPIKTKTVEIRPIHFEKRPGRIVRKLVRKRVSRLAHPFTDYDQSGVSVFQTSVDPRYV